MRLPHAVRSLLIAAIACGLSGCGAGSAEGEERSKRDDPSKDYGWFSYTAPDGWAKHEPSPGVIYAPTLVVFRPVSDETGRLRLEVRDVTDDQSRTERIPALYAQTRESEWRHQCAQAEKQGDPLPAFECAAVMPSIGGPGNKDEFSLLIELGGQSTRALVSFVELPDGRRFRADFRGADPDFTQHLPAITASLKSLTFPTVVPGPRLSHDEIVAALAEHLDDERLWLYDGEVAGQRLSDTHLEALADPTFAGVTDLNLISGHAAMMTGVDVTDAGLEHLEHLELTSLCLRGSLVTDAGLVHLKGLPLEILVLEGTLVEGEGLRHIADLPLKHLDLAGTGVGDEHLEHLAAMPLLSVSLRSTYVTDAGVAELERRVPGLLVSR